MFGFLQLKTCALSTEERLIYHSHFCAVCHAMTGFGGRVSSLLTNYDITFWLLLNSALDSEPLPALERLPCTALPLRKVPVRPLKENVARTLAALNLLLVDSKVRDDAQDGERVKAGVAGALFRKKFEKARAYLEASKFPVEAMLELPELQSAVEKSASPNLPKLCSPTEHTLGEVFATVAALQSKDELRTPLRRFGQCLGGYLYLWDALQDRDEDRKRGRFNALRASGAKDHELRTEFDTRLQVMRQILNSMALGPEGSLCFKLVNSLETRLKTELPQPVLSSVPSAARRLDKAGVVVVQGDSCCEVDCCQCGSCCDCNLCNCSPKEGEHCCDFSCCDCARCGAGGRHEHSCCDACDPCCPCCQGTGASRDTSNPCCCCQGCNECYACHDEVENYDSEPTPRRRRALHPGETEPPGLFARLKSWMDSKGGTKIYGAPTPCPACEGSMIKLNAAGKQIRECRNCGGMWLSEDLIEALAAGEEMPFNLLTRYPTGQRPVKRKPGDLSEVPVGHSGNTRNSKSASHHGGVARNGTLPTQFRLFDLTSV